MGITVVQMCPRHLTYVNALHAAPVTLSVTTRQTASVLDCVWNVMAHAQKPDFVFLWNGRVHLNQQGLQFSRLLAAEVCPSAVVMLDTPCSEVVCRVLATHSIRQFPLHFLSRASPCAIMFQLDSVQLIVRRPQLSTVHDFTLPTRCKWDFHYPYVTQRRLVDSYVSVPSSRTKPLEDGTDRSYRNLGNYQCGLYNFPEERNSLYLPLEWVYTTTF